ncbi:hypothetical protein [Streptomyces sp. NPDC088794]|uniref:hypothetical protein n=1 Tax=Streptomyces sp. NPDC088794 TaxID=3365902 RepID=UPI00380A08EA
MAKGQEQTAPDAVMTRIGQVVMLHHAGDREEARDRFLQLWAEIGEHGDALHRCTLAHYMADTQDDPADELAWDLRALTAAEELTDERLAEHEEAHPDGGFVDGAGGGTKPSAREGALAVRALYPSLHLNLAADYVKLGRGGAARTHLRRARGAAGALADDPYGDGVRAAISRLELRLAEEGPSEGGGWGPPRTGEGGWGPPRQRP